jgi:4-amino-4-deoxy-L-arabinose transferase-like glycosyltransferase
MGSKKYLATLWGIVFVEAFIVLVLLGEGYKGVLVGDGKVFHNIAENLVHHGVFALTSDVPTESPHPTMSRPPGYSLFLAGIYTVFGESFFIVRVVQFLLIWVTAVGIYWLARLYCDEASAKVSGVLCATYLPMAFFAIYHYSEILSAVLLVSVIYCAKSFTDKSRYIDAMLTGLLLGCLVLVRANFMLLVLFLAGGFMLASLHSQKHLPATQLKKLSIFVLSFLLVMTPWLLRNRVLSGKWVFSSAVYLSLYASALQYNQKLSYAFTNDDWKIFLADLNSRAEKARAELGDHATRPELELKIDESYKDSLSKEIRDINVSLLPRNLLLRVGYLWSANDMSPSEIYATFYHRIAQVHYLLISLLILVGVWRMRMKILSNWLLWITALYLTLVHLVFHIEARYSLPARPLLLIYASMAITAPFLKPKTFER